jgi:GTP-binding protein
MKIRNVELDVVCGYTSTLPELDAPEIAFAGRSNVGKSSLINVLMQRKRLARVGETPGKTRTINFYKVDALMEAPVPAPAPESAPAPAPEPGTESAPESTPEFVSEPTPKSAAAAQVLPGDRNEQFYLVDLPGYGYANVSVQEKAKWGKMVERYLKNSPGLKAVFLLVDIRHEPNANDRQMYDWITASGYTPIIVATKADKIKRSQLQKQARIIREGLHAPKGTVVIPFSALTRDGREKISGKIGEILEGIE